MDNPSRNPSTREGVLSEISEERKSVLNDAPEDSSRAFVKRDHLSVNTSNSSFKKMSSEREAVKPK